jgi:hypothetical protein
MYILHPVVYLTAMYIGQSIRNKIIKYKYKTEDTSVINEISIYSLSILAACFDHSRSLSDFKILKMSSTYIMGLLTTVTSHAYSSKYHAVTTELNISVCKSTITL